MKNKLNKRNLVVIAVIALVIAIVLSSFVYLNYVHSQSGAKATLTTVKVAGIYGVYDALFWVAQQQGYFAENGLNVTSYNAVLGPAAINSVLSGDSDIAVGASEYALVPLAAQNASFQVFGTQDKIDFAYLIGLKDHGVNSISDLAGKRVGVAFGTLTQFYLGRLLELNNLSIQNVTLVNIKTTSDGINSMVNGTVDATIITQPALGALENDLGDNAFVISAQSSQLSYSTLVSSRAWIAAHPELIEAFLKSLAKAENYVIDNPDSAKMIVGQQMNLTKEVMDSIWTDSQHSLSLDQSMLLAMQDEARWLINNNLTNATAIPNFLNFIYLGGLESVKPNSVTIIH